MARLGAALLLLLAAAYAAGFAAAGGPEFGALDAMMAAGSATRTCDGLLGECAADDADDLAGFDTAEGVRRSLYRQPTKRYISYAALKADRIPCSKRGRSYYSNCNTLRPANPYRRGCSVITRCARNML